MNENISIDYISRLLNDTTFAEPAEAQLVQAFGKAHALAKAAYQNDESPSLALAERILHFTFRQNGFMQPTNTLASVIVSVISQAKVKRAFKDAATDPGALKGDLREVLEAAVKKWGGYNHPLLTAIADEGRAQELRIWAKNFAASGREFTTQLFVLGAHCTTTKLQDFLVENLHEEFEAVPHIDLRSRYFGRLGIDQLAPVDYADDELQTEFLAQSNFRTCLVNLKDPYHGFGSFFVTERNWGLEAGVLHENFKKLGFTVAELEFLALHAGADGGHAEEWMNKAVEAAVTPEQKSQVLLAGIAQLMTRRRMYDALYARLFGHRKVS